MQYKSKNDFIKQIKSNGASDEIQKAIIANTLFYKGYIIKKSTAGYKIINSVFNDNFCVACNLSTAKKWVDIEISELKQ